MSTRQERQAWQDFREAHGVTVAAFKNKWRAMFNREPNEIELLQYNEKRDELRKPLGRKKTVSLDDPKLVIGKPQQLVTATKRYEWDMGHRLPNHQGKCRRLHGHRYVLEVDITGPVQTEGAQEGMVIDFYPLKEILDQTIGYWDHRTMLHRDDPIYQPGHENEAWGIFRVDFIPTAENIAREIYNRLKPRFSVQGLSVSRVRVYETPSGWAEVKA